MSTHYLISYYTSKCLLLQSYITYK